MHTIRPLDTLAMLQETWSPRVLAELNGQYLKAAKLEGEFVWHTHADEDELFIVLYGTLHIALEQGELVLQAGECAVVPRGIPHKPWCEGECGILLLEPVATRHTGADDGPRTVPIERQLAC